MRAALTLLSDKVITKAKEWWRLVKNDTAELKKYLIRYLKQNTNNETKNPKHLNIWAYPLVIIIAVLSVYIMFPLIGSMASMFFESTEVTPEISRESVSSFIILATALGSLITWFSKSQNHSHSNDNQKGNVPKLVGKAFLFSAVVLSLFLISSPLISGNGNDSSFYSDIVSFISFFSLISGCFSFIFALIISVFFILKF